MEFLPKNILFSFCLSNYKIIFCNKSIYNKISHLIKTYKNLDVDQLIEIGSTYGTIKFINFILRIDVKKCANYLFRLEELKKFYSADDREYICNGVFKNNIKKFEKINGLELLNYLSYWCNYDIFLKYNKIYHFIYPDCKLYHRKLLYRYETKYSIGKIIEKKNYNLLKKIILLFGGKITGYIPNIHYLILLINDEQYEILDLIAYDFTYYIEDIFLYALRKKNIKLIEYIKKYTSIEDLKQRIIGISGIDINFCNSI